MHGLTLSETLHLLTTLWSVVAVLLLLPCAVLFTEVWMALGSGSDESRIDDERPSVAILVPAHNEAPIIASTLRCLAQQLDERDRILVIADNCTDATAAVARAQGAEALERTDATRRGKGYALDFAVRYLERSAPEVVIVVDADCQVGPGCIEHLARTCATHSRPIQARYRLLAPEGAGMATRMKAFACALKNETRALGLHRLGLPCQLMGSGMAFPWALIRTARLASAEIVEDLQLGIELARARTPPLYCPGAEVSSELPASSEGMQSQRARWEHGHLAAIAREGPRLLLGSLAQANWGAAALAADLMVPPLALLVLLLGAHWLISVALFVAFKTLLPLLCSSFTIALLTASVLLAWLRDGRELLPFRALAFAPFYALGKTQLYARFLRGRQQGWVRSRRNHEAP